MWHVGIVQYVRADAWMDCSKAKICLDANEVNQFPRPNRELILI